MRRRGGAAAVVRGAEYHSLRRPPSGVRHRHDLNARGRKGANDDVLPIDLRNRLESLVTENPRTLRVGVVGTVAAGKTSLLCRIFHEAWLQRLAAARPDEGPTYEHCDDDRYLWHRELKELRDAEEARRAAGNPAEPHDGDTDEFSRLMKEPRRSAEGDVLKAIAGATGHVNPTQSSTVAPIVHDMTAELAPGRDTAGHVNVSVIDTPGVGATIGDQQFTAAQLQDMVVAMCTAEKPLLDFIVVVINALEPITQEKRNFMRTAHDGLRTVVANQARTTSLHTATDTVLRLNLMDGHDVIELRDALARSRARADSMAPGQDGREDLITRAATKRMLVVLTNSDRARPAEIRARRHEISSGDEAVLPGVAVVAVSAVGWDGDPDGEKVPTWYNSEDARVGDLLGGCRSMIENGFHSVVDCHTIDILSQRVLPELRRVVAFERKLNDEPGAIRKLWLATTSASGGGIALLREAVVAGRAANTVAKVGIGAITSVATAAAGGSATAGSNAAVAAASATVATTSPISVPVIIGGATVGLAVGAVGVWRKEIFCANPPRKFEIHAVDNTSADVGFVHDDPSYTRVCVELRTTKPDRCTMVRMHNLPNGGGYYRLSVEELEAATVYGIRIAMTGTISVGVFTPWLSFKTHSD